MIPRRRSAVVGFLRRLPPAAESSAVRPTQRELYAHGSFTDLLSLRG